MDRMEKPPLQTFVTWQKAVRLAAHLYRLSWAEEHRPQGEDLRREAMHLACALQLSDDLEGIVTYDHRMAAACHILGLPVVSPGQP